MQVSAGQASLKHCIEGRTRAISIDRSQLLLLVACRSHAAPGQRSYDRFEDSTSGHRRGRRCLARCSAWHAADLPGFGDIAGAGSMQKLVGALGILPCQSLLHHRAYPQQIRHGLPQRA